MSNWKKYAAPLTDHNDRYWSVPFVFPKEGLSEEELAAIALALHKLAPKQPTISRWQERGRSEAIG